MNNHRYWLKIVCLIVFCSTQLHAESLYNPAKFKSLVTDYKASRVGDSVTLLIVETSQASSNADSGDNMSFGAALGFNKTNRSELGNLDVGFNGDDSKVTSRAGNLRARISTVVEQQDNNGRLLISGNQDIIVNGEKQTIIVKGWIRPVDISSANTVMSTRLSNASIEYKGYDESLLDTAGGLIKKVGKAIIWLPQKTIDMTNWLVGKL